MKDILTVLAEKLDKETLKLVIKEISDSYTKGWEAGYERGKLDQYVEDRGDIPLSRGMVSL